MPKVKGTIMLPLMKGLRANAEEARPLLPPELHHYLDERILQTSWYSEDDHLVLLRVMGKCLGIGVGGTYVPMGYVLAQFELTGVYRGALHEGDVERSLKSFAKLWPQNHDTGVMELSEKRNGVYALVLTDYALAAREICDIVTGYLVEGVRMASGTAPTVTHVRCRARGAPQCTWDITP